MKKLLMIGAILVLGATSFAGVSVELDRKSNGGDPATFSYEGTGKMTVGSTGMAVEGTNNGMLVVTPTMSAGADGTSLEFSFGDLVKGSTSTVTGRFTAEIIKEDGIAVALKNSVKSYLETVDSPDVDGSQTRIQEIQLTSGNANNVGKLSYELTNKVNNNDKTYEGEIIAKVTADGANTGYFSDKSARVVVEVTSGDWKN